MRLLFRDNFRRLEDLVRAQMPRTVLCRGVHNHRAHEHSPWCLHVWHPSGRTGHVWLLHTASRERKEGKEEKEDGEEEEG